MRVLFFLSKQEEETSERQSKSTKEGLRTRFISFLGGCMWGGGGLGLVFNVPLNS